MKEANHAFAPPIEGAGTVPREVARYLDGTDQLTKTHGCCCQKTAAAVALQCPFFTGAVVRRLRLLI
jgi:hypothetical protein